MVSDIQHGAKPILVTGSANTDLVVTADRLPGAGETVLGNSFQTFAGGKGANQAVAAARAGAHVTFLAALGTDDNGDRTVAGLAIEGIDTSLIKRIDGTPSGVALIVVDKQGRNQIVVASGANSDLKPADYADVDWSRYGCAVFQLETPLDTVTEGLRLAKRAGVMTILNPAPAATMPDEALQNTDILVPNEHELLLLSGEEDDTRSLQNHARRLLRKGVGAVIMTCGDAGAHYLSDTVTFHQPGLSVTAVDTVGAGDCFVGSLACALSEGLEIEAALRFANAAAALSVTRPGAQAAMPMRNEILDRLQE